jgi:hypothetical protein
VSALRWPANPSQHPKQNIGDLTGLVSSLVSGDLTCFKDFIETHHSATGGGRGEIPHRRNPLAQTFKTKAG